MITPIPPDPAVNAFSVTLVRLDDSPTSPAGAIGAAAVAELIGAGGRVRTIDIVRLPSVALDSALESDAIGRALRAIVEADVVLLAWSGLDARGVELFRSLIGRLPEGALRGRGAVAIGVGPTPADSLRAELRLQGLLRSFGAVTETGGRDAASRRQAGALSAAGEDAAAVVV